MKRASRRGRLQDVQPIAVWDGERDGDAFDIAVVAKVVAAVGLPPLVQARQLRSLRSAYRSEFERNHACEQCSGIELAQNCFEIAQAARKGM